VQQGEHNYRNPQRDQIYGCETDDLGIGKAAGAKCPELVEQITVGCSAGVGNYLCRYVRDAVPCQQKKDCDIDARIQQADEREFYKFMVFAPA
jgi:hypothetical protein